MGGGSWDVGSYTSSVASNKAAGKSNFDYSDRAKRGQVSVVNPLVDPLIKAGDASAHAGQVMREVIISDEHPRPVAVAVVLDVTGSNITAATIVHEKLPQLHGMLQRKGYAEDPQMLFMAIGDANSDRFPLQVGQFESDNRMDDQIAAIILEGNGGGQKSETYELGAYFLARHTYLEPFDKHGKKGIAVFIGDELPYATIKNTYGRNHTMESLTGDKLTEPIDTKVIFDELQEKYDVYFLFQAQGAYRAEDILPAWRKLLGERAQVLDDPAGVCEFICGIVGMREAGLSADEVVEDLIAAGADSSATKAAGKALALVGGGNGTGTGGVATIDGTLPSNGNSGATRL